LALQAVGRKLGFLDAPRVSTKAKARIFFRYLGEVALAVSSLNQGRPRRAFEQLPSWKEETAKPTWKMDDRGRVVEEDLEDFATMS
jgi:hypothetical protein